jgi:hypothetical protein
MGDAGKHEHEDGAHAEVESCVLTMHMLSSLHAGF